MYAASARLLTVPCVHGTKLKEASLSVPTVELKSEPSQANQAAIASTQLNSAKIKASTFLKGV